MGIICLVRLHAAWHARATEVEWTHAKPEPAICAHVGFRTHRSPSWSLQVLLVRHTPEELEAMVSIAVELIDGASEAVDFAQQRRELCRVRLLPACALAAMSRHLLS